MLKTLRSNWIALASSLTLLAAIGYILSQQQKLGEIVEVWRQIDQWYFALAVVLTWRSCRRRRPGACKRSWPSTACRECGSNRCFEFN